MAIRKFKARCRLCGSWAGGGMTSAYIPSGKPHNQAPGKCTASASGKHDMIWEEVSNF